MKFRTRVAAVTALAPLAIAGLVACAPPTGDTGDRTLTVGVTWIHFGNNPLNYSGNYGPYKEASYEGLFRLGQEDPTELVPWLAESVSLSDDGKTLTLGLRENVTFQDGTHLDAAAVAESLTAEIASESYTWHGTIANDFGTVVTATDEYTLEVTTTRRMDYSFLGIFGTATQIVSPAAIKDQAALEETPAGTGPYLIDEVVPDVSISFVRYPDYWDPEAAYFDRITFQIFSDSVAALNALKSGQIDATAIDSSLAAEADSLGFAIHSGPGLYATLIVLDNAGRTIPALGDVRVRQAISMAFDREAIAETLELGYGNATSQAEVPGFPGYVEGADDRFGYHLDRARELMAEAGYADGFDLVIPVPQTGGPTSTTKYEPIVKQSLADIGIRVTYEGVEDATVLTSTTDDGRFVYPIVLSQMFAGNTLYLLQGTLPGGYGGMMNDEAREILDSYNNGSTQAEVNDASRELGEFLLDEAWYIPFSHPLQLWATDAGIDMTIAATTVPLLDIRGD